MKEPSDENKNILVGFLSKTIKGPIPIMTRVYVEGLKSEFNIVPFFMERAGGKENLASFNFMNIFYFIKHYVSWCYSIIVHRPYIAHFPVTSYWNMEKSLLFLTTARILGVKRTIGHLHGGAFIDFWNNISPFRRKIALKQLNKLDNFIVLSDSWRKNIIMNTGIEPKRVRVLHNLIDSGFEDHFRDFKRDYSEKAVITVLAFNIMDSRKGLFDLLDAAKLLKERYSYKMVLIGDEREPNVRGKAERIVNENKLTGVSLAGGVWGEEKLKWFEKADILVLPSYIENFPVVVLEAACAGIPVIASGVGALPDIFSHDHDILFINAGNIPELVKNIGDLISDPGKRRRLGENIRHKFENELQGKRIISQLGDIYQDLLETNKIC